MHWFKSDRPETICGLKFKAEDMGIPIIATELNGTYILPMIGEITTLQIEDVDCFICKQYLISRLYHCRDHGFLSGVEITNNERCSYCNKSV